MGARPALRTIALLALRGCLELSASAAPLPAFVTPRFNASRSLASLPGIDVRDPTTALWDPASRTWHLYATHQPSGAEGYAAGQISHFSLNASRFDDPTARWRHEGASHDRGGSVGSRKQTSVRQAGKRSSRGGHSPRVERSAGNEAGEKADAAATRVATRATATLTCIGEISVKTFAELSLARFRK